MLVPSVKFFSLRHTHICIYACIHTFSCTYALSNTFKYTPFFLKSRLLLSYATVLFIIKQENDVGLWVKLWQSILTYFNFKNVKYEKRLHGVSEYYVYIFYFQTVGDSASIGWISGWTFDEQGMGRWEGDR